MSSLLIDILKKLVNLGNMSILGIFWFVFYLEIEVFVIFMNLVRIFWVMFFFFCKFVIFFDNDNFFILFFFFFYYIDFLRGLVMEINDIL